MKKNRKGQKDIIGKLKIFFFIVTLVVLLDRLTKYFSFNYLVNKIELIPGFIDLKFTVNTGAAFSMFSGKTFFLIIISVIFILLILFNINSIMREKYFFAVALILGGAISNLFDRIFYGFVIDFVSVRFFSVFNFADATITVGAFILFIYLLKDFIKK